MYQRIVQRIIYLKSMKLFSETLKNKRTNNSNDSSRPQINVCTTPRDADEPCEDPTTELVDTVVLHQLGLGNRLLVLG